MTHDTRKQRLAMLAHEIAARQAEQAELREQCFAHAIWPKQVTLYATCSFLLNAATFDRLSLSGEADDVFTDFCSSIALLVDVTEQGKVILLAVNDQALSGKRIDPGEVPSRPTSEGDDDVL